MIFELFVPLVANVSFGTGDYTRCFPILLSVLNDLKKAERSI
jgi:hypothetical protein